MLKKVIFATAICFSTIASANAWEKNFTRWVNDGNYIRSESEPEVRKASGDVEADMRAMYRAGFVPVGYSSFQSENSKTSDAKRWAKKLGAAYLIILTNLDSSRSGAIPMTMPKTTTTTTNGTASVFGSGGNATGTYSGTSTTYGSSTTYIPFTVNSYSKLAIYFVEEPKFGAGIYSRELTDTEIQRVETRRAIAVRFVRDNSPAYFADILPNDLILEINGKPADPQSWWAEILDEVPDTLKVDRGGKVRELVLTIPAEWRQIPQN